jgi:hypothetical protein
MSAFAFLFPEKPRSFPGRRLIKGALRAAHILCTGIYVGGHVFAADGELIFAWMVASLVTGVGLLLTDLYASMAILCEVRGLAVLAKLVLIGLPSAMPAARVPMLMAAVLVGAVSSHLPASYRHFIWIGQGRIVPDTRKG